ncbi:N-acetylmuramoyl-L-alanine amidase [Lishizhenia tianjinensis]|uniref:N-acetylmuramoyl-L-alanine amidase n=1 Tax=Lishizhenia tianjinensis TaxID=477690 RepID=A0A1I6YBB4_9FLAO|nr:N-acetylmuramoyl-L-alanine amidase [Lishizhenia tianjinensis]SFT47816.1 N-acetylmuramoyl-L-alanine amidase [Lishizhenia tianjinensis]
MNILNTLPLIQTPLDNSQYYRKRCDKKQIVLHHTVSNGIAENVIAGWNKNAPHIATAFVIAGDGTIHQCFYSEYWAHHLGVKAQNNTVLNQQSIGIELCSWGPLEFRNNKFYNTYNQEVTDTEIQHYKNTYRGHHYYQRYKQKQLASLQALLFYLCLKYKIPMDYDPLIWEVHQGALNSKPGIYSHVSYRKDKADCHPQRELIEFIKNLKSIKI